MLSSVQNAAGAVSASARRSRQTHTADCDEELPFNS
jgi:hypothetical protein